MASVEGLASKGELETYSSLEKADDGPRYDYAWVADVPCRQHRAICR